MEGTVYLESDLAATRECRGDLTSVPGLTEIESSGLTTPIK